MPQNTEEITLTVDQMSSALAAIQELSSGLAQLSKTEDGIAALTRTAKGTALLHDLRLEINYLNKLLPFKS